MKVLLHKVFKLIQGLGSPNFNRQAIPYYVRNRFEIIVSNYNYYLLVVKKCDLLMVNGYCSPRTSGIFYKFTFVSKNCEFKETLGKAPI